MVTLAVDWDDTLVDARTQEWLPDAVLALRELQALGYKLILHTCRANWPEGLASIEAKLSQAALSIPVHVGAGKPSADKYIDNQGITFPGTWSPILAHFRALSAQKRIEKAATAHAGTHSAKVKLRPSPFSTLKPLS